MLIEPVIEAQLKAHRLGDKRLDRRCAQVQQDLLKGHTSHSFPQLFNQPYQLKAFYRLLLNPKLTPQAIQKGYQRGLLEWVRKQPERPNAQDQHYWFLFQDSSFGKYHNHSLELGYIQNADDNGLLLHHGILTDHQFVPLGLPIQTFLVRNRAEYGKSEERKKRPFADKESAKWIASIDWARRFSRQSGHQLVQVCDREADLNEVLNYSLKARQPFIIRANHDRRLHDSALTLSSYEQGIAVVHTSQRVLLDSQGKKHSCNCKIRYGRLALRGLDKPINVVYLQQLDPIQDQELAHWTVLTSLPIQDLSDALAVLDGYCHRWPTCEDFHKCLKSGCAIEDRHLHSQQALFGAISLLSLVAIGLLRLRHLAVATPDSAVESVLEANEQEVATKLAGRYLTKTDKTHCQQGSVLWFVLLLARMGGHQGIRQAGLPGWQTIWRGYQQFSLLVDGYTMSKNEYSERKPPTYG
jgi:hypothetical protein